MVCVQPIASMATCNGSAIFLEGLVRCKHAGWLVSDTFPDYAMSGSTTLWLGCPALLARLSRASVDIVVAESLDWNSRHQEHVASFYQWVRFTGARIIAVFNGRVGVRSTRIGRRSPREAVCARCDTVVITSSAMQTEPEVKLVILAGTLWPVGCKTNPDTE